MASGRLGSGWRPGVRRVHRARPDPPAVDVP